MNNINKILFPIDFSKVSPVIVPWVLTIAEKFDAEIHLLFVARKLGHFLSIDVSEASVNAFEAEIVRAGEKQMSEFTDRHFSRYPHFKTSIKIGDAAEEIINYIETENIDLVIIGSHGRKTLDRIIFGSVANMVIKKAQAPVLSINPYRIPDMKSAISS